MIKRIAIALIFLIGIAVFTVWAMKRLALMLFFPLLMLLGIAIEGW